MVATELLQRSVAVQSLAQVAAVVDSSPQGKALPGLQEELVVAVLVAMETTLVAITQ
jgi:hypothetical protein